MENSQPGEEPGETRLQGNVGKDEAGQCSLIGRAGICKDMGSETLAKNVLCPQHKQLLLGPSSPSPPGAPTRKRTAESSNIFESSNILNLCVAASWLNCLWPLHLL